MLIVKVVELWERVVVFVLILHYILSRYLDESIYILKEERMLCLTVVVSVV